MQHFVQDFGTFIADGAKAIDLIQKNASSTEIFDQIGRWLNDGADLARDAFCDNIIQPTYGTTTFRPETTAAPHHSCESKDSNPLMIPLILMGLTLLITLATIYIQNCLPANRQGVDDTDNRPNSTTYETDGDGDGARSLIRSQESHLGINPAPE